MFFPSKNRNFLTNMKLLSRFDCTNYAHVYTCHLTLPPLEAYLRMRRMYHVPTKLRKPFLDAGGGVGMSPRPILISKQTTSEGKQEVKEAS